jgi:hypothetical protein
MNPNNTTVTNITNITFDSCLEQLGEAMSQSYFLDEEGAPVEMDDEQKDGVEKTIEQVKNVAIETFGPLFQQLSAQIAEQGKRIEQLRASGVRGPTSSAASAASKASALAHAHAQEPRADGLPNAAELIALRKSKSGKKLTGYNCYTLFYMHQNKSGFPAKGLWDEQNKAAWNALAAEVNAITLGGEAAAPSVASATTAHAVASGAKAAKAGGKIGKITGYNMYTKDYMAKNPGAGFPAKGTWQQLPKDQVAMYQAQADAAMALRA